MIPAEITTFAELIEWLAQTREGGNYLKMARTLSVSNALIHFWKGGVVKHPTDAKIKKLCAAYGLDPLDIVGLLYRDRFAGTIVKIIAALTICGVLAASGTLAHESQVPDFAESRHYVKYVAAWLRRLLAPTSYPIPLFAVSR